jgi:uncharacterized protein YfeS
MIEPEVDIQEDILDVIQDKIILTLDKINDINQVFDYVKLIMEALEPQPIPGKTKKVLALNILRNIMDQSELEETKKAECIALIDNNIISNAIDVIIAAASGKMEINMPTLSTASATCSNFIIPCGLSLLTRKQK